jgi:hypothetical protein
MPEFDPIPRVGTPGSRLGQDLDVLTRAQTSLEVGCPASDVWRYVADFLRHIDWMHTVLQVDALTEGPVRVGARYLVRGRQDRRWDKRPFDTIAHREGLDYVAEVGIQEVDGSRILWQAQVIGGAFLPGSRSDWTFVLEPVVERVTMARLACRVQGDQRALLDWMQELKTRGLPLDVLQRQLDRSMHNLRAILEGRV